jgi:hypothetical protein
LTFVRWFSKFVVEREELVSGESSDLLSDEEIRETVGRTYHVHRGEVVLLDGGMREYARIVGGRVEKRLKIK